LKEVRASRFNLQGPYNDDSTKATAQRLRDVQDPQKPSTFKVPTLRHLMLTAPYGHHGDIETLAEVVRHYSERGSIQLKPLGLTAREQTDLVVFLESLSTLNNPWRLDDFGRCN